jgi:hypothetical protein
MLELARQRLGPDADLQVADLSRPLPYPDAAFDDANSVPGAALLRAVIAASPIHSG